MSDNFTGIRQTIDIRDLEHFMLSASRHLSSIAYHIENMNISLMRIEKATCGERPSIPDPFIDDCEASDQ